MQAGQNHAGLKSILTCQESFQSTSLEGPARLRFYLDCSQGPNFQRLHTQLHSSHKPFVHLIYRCIFDNHLASISSAYTQRCTTFTIMQLSSSVPAAALLSLLLLTSQTAAQDQPSNLPNLSSITSADSSSADSSKPSSTGTAKESQTSKKSAKTTATAASNTASGSTPTSLPGLSTNSGYDGPTNLPTLAGGFNYPAPTVPPTRLAPFMQKSSLPSGTVFIAVGAALGFIGFIILAWRGLVAWSLHRSVRRDNTYGTIGKKRGGPQKSLFKSSGTPFYSHGMGSNVSLDPLNPSGKGGLRPQTPRQSLFFSPTAGAGMHTPGNHNSSTYLPAGYYAAGNSVPAGGAGMTHLGGGSNRLANMSLGDIGPKSQGYQRAQSLEPGSDSNSLHPSRGTENMPAERLSYGGRPSMSSGNLSLPPQGRAPSEYLEELFENYPPGAIPHE